MATPAPCGTFTAYKRHKRKGEPVDDACAQAARDQANERNEAKREQSASAVSLAISVAEKVEELDPLEEARDNLSIVKAVLRSGETPANTIANLTKRRDELVDRIRALEVEQEPAEVSKYDEIATRRRRRKSAA